MRNGTNYSSKCNIHDKIHITRRSLNKNAVFIKSVKRNMEKFRNVKLLSEMMESVLILRNSSLKLKMVADNAILRNYAVSSENISESIKIKTENSFYLKVNVCKFR